MSKQNKDVKYWGVVNDDDKLITDVETGHVLAFDNEQSAMKYIELIMAGRKAAGRAGRERWVKPITITMKPRPEPA